MMRILLTSLLLVTVALAGCAEETPAETDEPFVPTVASCREQGLELAEDYFTGELKCEDPNPTITLDLLMETDQFPAYSTFPFEWQLGTSQDISHTMRTEVRYSLESVSDDALDSPDDYGVRAQLYEHQNFVDGDKYNGTVMIPEPGTYYFRAYAAVKGGNYWGPEEVVTVTDVLPTDTVKVVDIAPGGPLGGLSDNGYTLQLGDAIQFTNGNPFLEMTVTTTNGPLDFELVVPAGGTSEEFVLTRPGGYSFTAENTLDTFDGSFNVAAPFV